jgi:hypothetical protein
MKLNKQKPMQIMVFIIAIVLFAACVPCQSLAMMVTLSTEYLTLASDLIITGEVQDSTSSWSDDKKSIYSIATVVTKEAIKGRLQQKSLKVMYEGGEIDGIGLRVSDVTPLRIGETVLLFLTPEKIDTVEIRYKIVGKAQGKYSIDKNGIARKDGYAGEDGKPVVENTIPLDILINEIKKYESSHQ